MVAAALGTLRRQLENDDVAAKFNTPEHISGMQVVTYSTVAALYFLTYDVLLTFGDEVNYIWHIQWSLTKFAFYFIRYFPILFLFSIQFYGTPRFIYTSHDCYIWNAYQAVASTLIIAGVDYILLLRIFALYQHNKTIKYLTLALYFTELITVSIGMGIAIPYLTYDHYCGVTDAPATFLIAAGVPILFQTYLFTITFWKFVIAVKSGWGNIPILRILVRDSTWAFILLFLILVSEALLYGLAEDAYIGILYGWLNALFSFCGYRILININKAGHTSRHPRSTVHTDTDIEFTSNMATSELDDRDESTFEMAPISVSSGSQPER